MTKTPARGAAPKGAAPRRVLDLDKVRQARAEARCEPVIVVLGGHEFPLPAEMPVDYVLLLDEGKLRDAFVVLLGDHAEQFFAQHPSLQDIEALMEMANDAYGVNPGEARASSGS